MQDYGVGHRWLYGTIQAAGLGAIAGSMEIVAMAAALKLSLTVVDFLLLGLAALVLMGMVSMMFSALAGGLHLVTRGWKSARAISMQLALAGGGVALYYLSQAVFVLISEERYLPAVAMGLMPIGFAGVIFFNAHFWLRKTELGTPPKIGFVPIAYGLGMGITLIAGLGYQTRDTGGAYALSGDKNVLLVTVDGLRVDRLSLYGGEVDMPNLTRLGAAGFVFENAVTPMPVPLPAHAAMLTGLHPLRHKVVRSREELARGYVTVAETLEKEGWATGAFVSHFDLDSGRGLSQGFRIYDDDFTPVIPAAARINLVHHLISFLADSTSPAWLLSRPDPATTTRFAAWLDAHRAVPWFGWVHYRGPLASAGTAESHAAGLAMVDAELGALLTLLEDAGLRETTLVIVTGSGGVDLAEHGPPGQMGGIWDTLVRVPLVIRAPEIQSKVPRIPQQIRLMDVVPTIHDYLGLDEPAQTEGVELLGYGEGHRRATMWCALLGETPSGPVIGLRNNGVKYIAAPEEALYDVVEDPGETTPLVDQDATRTKARMLMESEVTAFEALLGEPVRR